MMYRLIEADHYINKKILVVGGGDSAVEAAMGLGASGRQPGDALLSRRTLQPHQRAKRKAHRRLHAHRKSQGAVRNQSRRIQGGVGHARRQRHPQGDANDFVWIFAGGTPPNDFLKKIGVGFGARDLTLEASKEAKRPKLLETSSLRPQCQLARAPRPRNRPLEEVVEPPEAQTLKDHNSKALTVLMILLLSSVAGAQTLTGTVNNVTTGKPAAGDEIVLLKLGQGMEEAGRTKSDSKGNFSFNLDDARAPHLVRAIHQAVTYHRMAPPGTTSVAVEVYDVGKKIDGIEVVADIIRVQAEQGRLEVTREFDVQNSSKPPRTQMNERNLEFYLPEGAQIGEASAMTEHGNPVKSPPVPEGENNRYSFIFPLRPGITQFQLSYHLPYSGSATIEPKSLYPLQHFLAIVPRSMEFSAASGDNFKPMNDPNQPDANVQLASTTTEGQTLAFKISGEGKLQARVETGGVRGENGSAQNDPRPGGGLGPPIDAPDPLQKYRWYILGGIAGVLVAGALYVAFRQQAAVRACTRLNARPFKLEEQDPECEFVEVPSEPKTAVFKAPTRPLTTRGFSSVLLEGLKEELFQLEVEHKQGDITQLEYDNARAALDHMLGRALKRTTAQPI